MSRVETISRVALFLGLALTGCVGGDKGAEDDPLGDDGKADSFYSPTYHGDLRFGPENRAEFTDDEHFHAWTFTLDDDATISLHTEVSGNLDTVMYLYRRDVGSTGSFGSYIKKNDDADDGVMYSQIDLDAGPGEYRVIVKAFKTAQRGPVAVLGSCSGDGCPGAGGTCTADSFPALPAAKDKLTVACASDLIDVLTTRTTAPNTTSVGETEVCTLDGVAKQGVDLYRAYWDDVQGWEDFKSGETDFEIEVSTVSSAAGSYVTVDIDAFDEDVGYIAFDASGDPLLFYQSNQSPDSRAFCTGTGSVTAPDTVCVEYMLASLLHSGSEMTGTASTSCEDATSASLPPLVGDPVCEFTAQIGIADTAAVSASYRTWRGDDGYLGATLTLTAAGRTGTYHLGTTWRDTTWIYASKIDSTVAFNCQEL